LPDADAVVGAEKPRSVVDCDSLLGALPREPTRL
jgi:hypothetical protein